MKTRATRKPTGRAKNKQNDPRQRTNVPGQNPKADDSADKDEHHDDNRINPLRSPDDNLD